MSREIAVRPLAREAFAPFGQVLEARGAPTKLINAGLCGRHHDLARPDVEGVVGISVFDATPRALPYALAMVERHPLGSQAFVPMHSRPWLVIVAPDRGGAPDRPLAFLAGPGQGVQLARGTWHGVLTPLHAPGLFAVIDRIGAPDAGPADNLEEHWFAEPWQVVG